MRLLEVLERVIADFTVWRGWVAERLSTRSVSRTSWRGSSGAEPAKDEEGS